MLKNNRHKRTFESNIFFIFVSTLKMDKIVFDLYKRKYFLEFLLVFSFKKKPVAGLKKFFKS